MINLLVMALEINVSHSTEGSVGAGGKGKIGWDRESREPSPVIRFFSHLFRTPDREIYKKIKETAVVRR